MQDGERWATGYGNDELSLVWSSLAESVLLVGMYSMLS